MEIKKILEDRVHYLRQMVGEHPQMLVADNLMIEGFVAGFENYCSSLGCGLTEVEGFDQFKSGDIWSAESFMLAFQRWNSCELGFVAKSDPKALDYSRSIKRQYNVEFGKQWMRYIESIRGCS